MIDYDSYTSGRGIADKAFVGPIYGPSNGRGKEHFPNNGMSCGLGTGTGNGHGSHSEVDRWIGGMYVNMLCHDPSRTKAVSVRNYPLPVAIG